MSQADEMAELRRWLREDSAKNSTVVAKLHEKLDRRDERTTKMFTEHMKENTKSHACLQNQLSDIKLNMASGEDVEEAKTKLASHDTKLKVITYVAGILTTGSVAWMVQHFVTRSMAG